MITTKTISLERFKSAVGFTATYSCKWGNTRKALMEKVSLQSTAGGADASATETSKAKKRLKMSKQLIESPEYDAIKSFMGELRGWVSGRTVPSFFKEGFQLSSLAGVADIQARMEKAVNEELPALVDAFVAAYPAQVREARAVLEPVGQFSALDYPAAEELREAFDISWAWIAFVTPAGLPPELRQAEEDKMQRSFQDASEQITQALRSGMQELIAHTVERLTPGPDGKAKIFRESAIGNILEFLETFQNRNIANDVELAALVGKAKEVLAGVTPQKLRDLASVRATTLAQFTEIRAKLDGMIVTKPSRKFDFSQDAPAAVAPPVIPEPAQAETPAPSEQPELAPA